MMIDLVDSVPSWDRNTYPEDLAKIVSVVVIQLPGVVLATVLLAVSIQKKGRCDELGRGRITTVVAGADQA
jgi:hypothetical protein